MIMKLNKYACTTSRFAKPDFKHFIRSAAFILVFLLSALTFTGAAADTEETENILINGDFESVESKDPAGWSFESYLDIGSGFSDSTVAYSGKSSVKIYNNKATDSRFLQTVQVQPDTVYEITCWVKTKGVGKKTGFGANISFKHSFSHSSQEIRGTVDWKKIVLYAKSTPEQTEATLSVGLGGYGNDNTGTVWVDDVRMRIMTEEIPSGYTVETMELNAKPSDNTSKDINSSSTLIFVILSFVIIALCGAIYYALILRRRKSNVTSLSRTDNAPAPAKKPDKNKEATLAQRCTPEPPPKLRLKGFDFLLMGVVTAIYSMFAFYQMGSTEVPQTTAHFYQPDSQFVINLHEPITFNKIGFFAGYAEGEYIIEALDVNGKFKKICELSLLKEDSGAGNGQIFRWHFKETTGQTETTAKLRVKITNDGDLNELILIDPDNNPLDISDATYEELSNGIQTEDVSKLTDEQQFAVSSGSFQTDTYFDEIYHAKTAYENLEDLPVYECSHPPLAKYIIAQGIRLFGMNPFGYRIAGVFFGILMVPIMYLFGLKLFRRRFFAFAAMLLMAVEFMHYSMSRIATIDTYGTFFIILMYYFMFDYYTYKSYNIGYRRSLYLLFMTGIMFGLGSASKWICVYAGGGLATLFVMVKFQEYKEFISLRSLSGTKLRGWLKTYIRQHILATIAFCCLFFIFIPIGIYYASYIPTYLDVKKDNLDTPAKRIQKVLDNQEYMFNYHSKLKSEKPHPYAAKWYEWPVVAKPLLAYRGSPAIVQSKKPDGSLKTTTMSSSITFMGHPLILWSFLIFLPWAVYLSLTRKTRKRGMTVIFVAMIFQYVPWMLISRETYMYHYYSTIPFAILTNLYVFYSYCKDSGANAVESANTFKELFSRIGDKRSRKQFYNNYGYLIVYLLLCTAMFIAFFPAISGMIVPSKYITYIKWFKNSTFFKWPF